MSAELFFFSAAWCEPCKWAEPIVDDVLQKMDGRISLRKIDIDANVEMARDHHVMSVPTLVLFKDGKEVWRMRGFDTAPKLERIFQEHL